MTTISQITKMLELLGDEYEFDPTDAMDFLKEEAPELFKKKSEKTEKKSTSSPRKSRKGVMTGWFLFRRENKGTMKEQSGLWKALSDEERTEFSDRAKDMNANRKSDDSDDECSSASVSSSPAVSPTKKSRKGQITGWILFRRENKDKKMKEQSEQWKALSDDEREEFKERAVEMNANR